MGSGTPLSGRLRPHWSRINWDNCSGAQSSEQEEKSCRSQMEQVPWVRSVPGVLLTRARKCSEDSRGSWGAWLVTWKVLSKVLNPHFEPTDHLCSKGTDTHSKAETELFTLSLDKTHFPWSLGHIFQYKSLGGKHLPRGGKGGSYPPPTPFVWIINHLSKYMTHGRCDFFLPLEEIRLSLPFFPKGTQFISKKFKEEKCVFTSGKSAHSTCLALKMDESAAICRTDSFIFICLPW